MAEQIEVLAGTDIADAAAALVQAAKSCGGEAVMAFNDVKLSATPRSYPAKIVARYQREMAERSRRWRNSPAGRAAAAESAAEVARLQGEADRLVAQLPDLDLANQAAVLDWLAALQPCSDRIGVRVDGSAILTAFAAARLTPNMCCGPDFDGEDRDTFFRWLVGQALDGLARGPAIHGIFHRFHGEWASRWGGQ